MIGWPRIVKGGTLNSKARSTALAVLGAVTRSDSLVTAEIRRISARLDLPPDVSALANQLALGVLRHRLTLDSVLARAASRGMPKKEGKLADILRLGAYELLFLDSVPDYATVSTMVDLARNVQGQKVAGFVNAVLRRVAVDGRTWLGELNTVEDRLSMPGWLVEEARLAFGETAGRELELLNSPATTYLMVNRQKTSTPNLAASLKEQGVDVSEIRGMPMSLAASHRTPPYQTQEFIRGYFWPQDLASQLVSWVASRAPSGRWLDVCTGHGGKALALHLLGRPRQLTAVDINPSRVRRFRARLAALGIDSIDVIEADARSPLLDEAAFSLVFLDAPCSGVGTLRHHPELRYRRTPEDLKRNARDQAQLLAACSRLVAPGGMLVYVVCSFSSVEGVDVVSEFLHNNMEFVPDVRVVQAIKELDESGGPKLQWEASTGSVLVRPSDLDADSFFAAFLRRTA